MGILHNLSIVLEADDITKNVQSTMSDITGKKEDLPDDTKNLNPPSKTTTPPTPSEPTKGDASANAIDDQEIDTDDIDVDGEDNHIEDIDDSENLTADNDEIKKKLQLRENIILFYNILSSNIDLLSSPNVMSSMDPNKVIYNVSSNLIECKNVLLKIITNDYSSIRYHEALKKYIAIKTVYDVCTRMLETHFTNLQLKSADDKKTKTEKK